MADRLPAVGTGARTTVSGIASTRLRLDVSDIIYDYEDMEAALYTTLSMLGKEDAINKTVTWHTDELVPIRIRINGGISNGLMDTTFTVDSPGGSYVGVGWQIQFTRTGETCVTTTGGSATTVVVTARSWGHVAAATIVDNDEILILGPAYGEAADLGTAVSTTEVAYNNTLQTVRHNWTIGGLMAELSKRGGTYGGDDTKRQRKKMIASHKRALELLVLMGEAATSGSTSTTYGFIPWIRRYAPANVNAATTVTESVFEAGNQVCFRGRNTSKRRVLMSSHLIHSKITDFGKAQVRRSQSDTSVGNMRVSNYQSTHGDLAIVRNVHLEGDNMQYMAFAFDPSGAYMKMGRDGVMVKNRQGTRNDSYEEEVITDLAPVLGHPEACYLWNDWRY